jgi:predicted transcriptional regulator
MNYQETSREAWREFVPASAKLDTQIMECLERNGPMICHDIEIEINRAHHAVSGNLRHLVERGLVENSGEYGKTPSGRRAIKWRIVKSNIIPL